MTTSVELRHNGPEVERILRLIPLEIERKAVPPALKRTADKTRTRIIRRLSRRVQVAQRAIRQQILRPRSEQNGLMYRLIGLVRGVRVSRLNPRQTRRGVSAGQRRFPGAFIVSSIGTVRHPVFQRVGRRRLPINVVTVPLEPAASRQMRISTRAMMRREFPIQLRSQLDRFLRRRRVRRRS